jgi:hypothetical protein
VRVVRSGVRARTERGGVGAAPLVASTELARRAIPGVDDLVDDLARRRRSRWFARHMGGRTAEYRPVEHFTR